MITLFIYPLNGPSAFIDALHQFWITTLPFFNKKNSLSELKKGKINEIFSIFLIGSYLYPTPDVSKVSDVACGPPVLYNLLNQWTNSVITFCVHYQNIDLF